MFGREPRLPVDVAMGLPQSKECPSKDYAAALQEKLRHAYEVVEACADEAAERQQRNYNTNVRAAVLAAGDRVLVKSVGVQGKNKLGDVWEEEPHLVHSQPNKDLPVYVVKREDDMGRTRTLHRNMLLPIGHLNFHDEERRRLPERRRLRRRTPRRPLTIDSDSSSIYSTEDEIRIPMMVPVGRDATPNLLTPEESPPEILMEDRTAGERNTGDDSEEQLSAPGSGGSLEDSLPVESEFGWRMRTFNRLRLILATPATRKVRPDQNRQETRNHKEEAGVHAERDDILTGTGHEPPRSVRLSWSSDQSYLGTVQVPHPSGYHGKRWDSVFYQRRGVCHQDFTTPFFIWMLAAVWWHCGQGLMRILFDSDWSTRDHVSSEILKTDSSSFLLNPQPMQTCAMIVPRLMTTCLWAHICNQQLLSLLQVSLLYYVLMYITCIARGAYCIFVNMVFKVIAPCLCIFCPL